MYIQRKKHGKALYQNSNYISLNTAESKEELQSALMKVKEESEKVGLKLNI